MHEPNELYPWISCLTTVTWLARLTWYPQKRAGGATAHEQNELSPRISCLELLPGWWGWAGDPAEWQCVTAHAQNELSPRISCLETVPWLVRLDWRPCWVTVCHCACATCTIPVNQLFGNCYLAGEAGLATPLNDSVSPRMRKWTIPSNKLFGNCSLAGEAGLATLLSDSVSLRMRNMYYSRESAVWKLLPDWWGWADYPAEWQYVTAHAQHVLFPWISCLKTVTWLVRLGWLPRWMTVCHCACAKWTISMNQLLETVTWLVRLGWRPRGRAGVPRLLGEEMQGPDKYVFLPLPVTWQSLTFRPLPVHKHELSVNR